MFVYDAANAETCPLCSPVHRSAKAGRAPSHSPGTLQRNRDTQTHYYILKKAYRSGADCNSCCPEFYSKLVVIKSL